MIALLWLGCTPKDDPSTLSQPDVLASGEDAEAAAAALIGGTAGTAEETSEDGFDLWLVPISMPNGAELEVQLFVSTGELFSLDDLAGPFDYDALDPLPGQLTYAEARDIADGEVEGEQFAWQVKYTGGVYFYEFYILEVGDQLWEIKLWSDSGEVFAVEPKEAVD